MGGRRPGSTTSSGRPPPSSGPVGTSPFTHLYAQRTRIVEQQLAPASLRTLATGSVVADFGRVYAGRPTVAFRDGTGGHTVPMHVGYLLDPDGAVSTTHGTQGTDLSFSMVQRDGGQRFDPYWYLGFRYLQVDEPGEAIGSSQVAVMARHAPMPAVPAATFSSSSAELDAVWKLCVHSALYTSQEQFIDTPTREKGPFLWDGANESEVVMRTFGDQNLSWQGLRDEARAQARYWPTTGQVNEVYPNDDGAQDYPTFTARYPEWVWRYYLSTGDKVTVVGLLPTLAAIVRLSAAGRRSVDRAGERAHAVHQRGQPIRLRLQHGGRRLHQHPLGQRSPAHRPGCHPGRRLIVGEHRVTGGRQPHGADQPVVGHTLRVSTSMGCGPTAAKAATPPNRPTAPPWPTTSVPPSGRPLWAVTSPPSTSRSSPTMVTSCCEACTRPDRTTTSCAC